MLIVRLVFVNFKMPQSMDWLKTTLKRMCVQHVMVLAKWQEITLPRMEWKHALAVEEEGMELYQMSFRCAKYIVTFR